MANKKEEICFLCGKSKSEVSHMIKGKFGYICDECVQAAHDVLNDNEEEDISYNMESARPSQIKSYLDSYVIGQDNAKRILAVGVFITKTKTESEVRCRDPEVQYNYDWFYW